MADHREDDDFVLAGSLVLHEMLLQEPTCSTLLNETEVRPIGDGTDTMYLPALNMLVASL
jgi:hypothetical protein